MVKPVERFRGRFLQEFIGPVLVGGKRDRHRPAASFAACDFRVIL